jgi:hypothetical protein
MDDRRHDCPLQPWAAGSDQACASRPFSSGALPWLRSSGAANCPRLGYPNWSCVLEEAGPSLRWRGRCSLRHCHFQAEAWLAPGEARRVLGRRTWFAPPVWSGREERRAAPTAEANPGTAWETPGHLAQSFRSACNRPAARHRPLRQRVVSSRLAIVPWWAVAMQVMACRPVSPRPLLYQLFSHRLA